MSVEVQKKLFSGLYVVKGDENGWKEGREICNFGFALFFFAPPGSFFGENY
jgi:hypothetical protein